jgi:hypothetical protein
MQRLMVLVVAVLVAVQEKLVEMVMLVWFVLGI